MKATDENVAAFADVYDSSTDATAELFPLILGIVLFIVVIAFTAFTLMYLVCQRREERCRNDDEDDANTTTRLGNGPRWQMLKATGEHNSHNSWVMGRRQSSSPLSQSSLAIRHSSPLSQVSLNVIEEGSTDINIDDGSALLSWSGLSCTYRSKKSGEVTVLSRVTGHIQYKELVAIMG